MIITQLDISISEESLTINGQTFGKYLTPNKVVKILGLPDRTFNSQGRNIYFSGELIYDRLGAVFHVYHDRVSPITLLYSNFDTSMMFYRARPTNLYQGNLLITGEDFPSPKKHSRKPLVRDGYLKKIEKRLFKYSDKQIDTGGFSSINVGFGHCGLTAEIDYRTQQICGISINLKTKK